MSKLFDEQRIYLVEQLKTLVTRHSLEQHPLVQKALQHWEAPLLLLHRSINVENQPPLESPDDVDVRVNAAVRAFDLSLAARVLELIADRQEEEAERLRSVHKRLLQKGVSPVIHVTHNNQKIQLHALLERTEEPSIATCLQDHQLVPSLERVKNIAAEMELAMEKVQERREAISEHQPALREARQALDEEFKRIRGYVQLLFSSEDVQEAMVLKEFEAVFEEAESSAHSFRQRNRRNNTPNTPESTPTNTTSDSSTTE